MEAQEYDCNPTRKEGSYRNREVREVLRLGYREILYVEYTKTFDHPASSESICLVLEASEGVWTLVYASVKGDASKSGKICEVDWENN